jgi:hypothetical protein
MHPHHVAKTFFVVFIFYHHPNSGLMPKSTPSVNVTLTCYVVVFLVNRTIQSSTENTTTAVEECTTSWHPNPTIQFVSQGVP